MENLTKEHLEKTAKKYDAEQLDLYIAEMGWEDWMNEYVENPDASELLESEIEKIKKLQIEVFAEVHGLE